MKGDTIKLLSAEEADGPALPLKLWEARTLPTELLTSPKSKALARALRHAADLAIEVGQERDWNPADSLGEVLSDMATQAEAEAWKHRLE